MRHFVLTAVYLSILVQVTAQKANHTVVNNSPESGNPLVFSNRVEKEFFNSDRKFEINGHIRDYAPDGNNRFISFRGYKVLGENRDTSIEVDKNGDFHAVLYQPFEGNTSFYYSSGDGFIFNDLFVSPGTTVTLSLDEKKIRAKEYSETFTSSGKFSLTNRLINDFAHAMKTHHFTAPDGWPDPKLSSDTIASYCNRRIKEELVFFHDYVAKEKISDSVFKRWEENNIIYTGGYRLAFSLFAGRMDTSLTYERYLSYFGRVPIGRPTALRNSAYYHFMKIFASGLEIVENINPKYRDEKNKNGNDIYPLALEQADRNARGIARDILYANLFDPKRLAQSDYGLQHYNKNVKDRFIQSAISKMAFELARAFQPYDVVERLKSYKVDDSLKTKLFDIFSAHKGKYVFVDFWGSWCGPCMLEMPVYPKFIAHFSTDSVRFLFLSYDMAQQGVDEVQRRYGIAGDFILLSPNEMRVLNNVLGFEEYPRHFFVDPGSRVISNDILSIVSGDEPSKATMEKVDRLIAKADK